MTGPRPWVIGVVRTSRRSRDDTPVQAALNPDDEGTIELDARYADALDGLADFSHVWLVTWLAALDGEPELPALKQVPLLLQRTPRELGIFATRGPRRPSPIGLSLVRLIGVDGTTVRFGGVDLVDGTPLLDLKPYVARFDQPQGPVRSGWFDELEVGTDITPAALRRPLLG